MALIGTMKYLTIGDKTYEIDIPIASASTLGGIKVGSGLTIDSTTGVLNATGTSITIDSEMSDSSTNPVQNKVIKEYVDDSVDGVITIYHGTSSSAASATTKTVTCNDFTAADLKAGAAILVTFNTTNTAAVDDLMLNVNSTGAKKIQYINNGTRGNLSSAGYLKASTTYLFVYDGTYWVVYFNYNTTYSSMTEAEITAGTGTTARTITPARLKTAVETWAPVSSVNGQTGDVTITVPTKTSDLTNDSNFVVDASYTHTDNNYTSDEKSKLSGIAAGAEVNQNAFSTIKVGTTDLAADSKTDTLTITAGNNITLTPTANTDSFSIAATDTTYDVVTAGTSTTTGGLMSQADKTKLNGIATGAEVNVQANWNETSSSSDAYIQNKPSIPTATSDLTNDSGFITGMTILSYGTSTWNDFLTAYNANKVVYCRASSNSNPASGSQTRLAFMASVNDATNPTNVEFQYYRSVNTHTASQQGDQVYIYQLDKTAGWSVTVREASVKVVAGTGLSGTYSNGTMTLTGPTISLNGSSTTSASFYAPTDVGTDGYVLTSNGSGAPTWAAAQSSSSYTATSPIDITGNDISHEDSGVTAGTYGSYNSDSHYYYIPSVTVDAKGHITSVSQSYLGLASSKSAGILSASDYSAFSGGGSAYTTCTAYVGQGFAGYFYTGNLSLFKNNCPILLGAYVKCHINNQSTMYWVQAENVSITLNGAVRGYIPSKYLEFNGDPEGETASQYNAVVIYTPGSSGGGGGM